MLLLTDRMQDGQRLQQVLAQVAPCTLVALHQPTPARVTSRLVVCDVALDSIAAVERLRNALAQMDLQPAIPILCLLRDPSLLTQAQAQMAGATATLLAQAQTSDLLGTVRALFELGLGPAQAAPVPVPLRDSVKATCAVLGDLLTPGRERQATAPETLNQASDVLLTAIGQAKIQAWLDVVWNYDDLTYQHCLLVAGLATAFAIELGLPPRSQQMLSQAALVHDIGKSQIPRRILNKAGPLTRAEAAIVRIHPVAGHALLAGERAFDPCLLSVVRHHHEYLDGSGYPDGLKGPQISRLVRMVTICDIYAALIERRPYKAPVSARSALANLAALGPKLDQALLGAFRNVVREV